MIAITAILPPSLADSFSSPTLGAVMLVKATVVLAAGSIVVRCARRADSATRHTIWALTLAGALGLPLGMIATPAWRVRVLPQVEQTAPALDVGSIKSQAAVPAAQNPRIGVQTPSPRPSSESVSPRADSNSFSGAPLDRWLPLVWIAGVLAVLTWMAIGRIGLERLTRRAKVLDSPEWRKLLDDERRLADVTGAVRLLASSDVSTPLTWGIRSPVILLPAEAEVWHAEHRVVVLRHELAHIARSDSLTQLVAGFTCSLYWFHPLAWVAARGLRAEQERACDDRVLSSGTPAADYAAHLLEVARSARALGAQGLVSLAMARPSQLEGRLLAVLNASRRRNGASPVTKTLGLSAAISLFVALSAFQPMPRVSALPRAVTPTIMATQFVPPRSPITTGNSATWSSAAAARSAFDSSFDKTVDVRDGGTLVLDLETGAGLTITGWDQPKVRVTGTLGGRDWRNTEVSLEQTASGARLTTTQHSRSRSQSTSHHFDIRVPRRFNLRVSSAGGGITLSDVDGVFTGNTGGGAIRIERASGRAEISTGGGNVRVTTSNLSGSVSTGGGSVFIQNGSGALEGHSGSGPIVYTDVSGSGSSSQVSVGSRSGRDDNTSVTVIGSGANVTIDDRTGEIRDPATGRITFRKSGGGVDLREALAGADIRTGGGAITIGRTGGLVTVNTGGGDIRIGPSTGPISASTGGGNIRLGPVTGVAAAATGKGDVTISLAGSEGHSVEVQSGTGKVVLILPANISAVLELETAYTESFGRRSRIESDWPLSVSQTDYWDDTQGTPRKYVRVRQTLGRGGNVIRVRTVNGDIVLQRAR